MNAKGSIDQTKKFWIWFNHIHLYKTKAEAIFKAVIITVSWIGGVHLTKQPETISREIGVAFYLFSLSLIMEYVIGLLTAKKIISKLFPFLICVLNILVFFGSTAILVEKPFDFVGYDVLLWGTIISLIIIWIDALTMIIIEPTTEEYIENNLKDI